MFRAFRLGVFIVGTLTILALGIFLIGNNQLLFDSTYRLKAVFPTVAGLDDGAEVRVGGIHKGTVRQIQLPASPDEKVTVVMDLEKSTRSIVKRDSVASIQTEGLLGSKYVEVSFGSEDSPSVNDWDTLAGEPPLDFSQLLAKADQILDSTKDAVNNVKETASNLKTVSAGLEEGKGTVGALLNNRQVYDQINAAATQAKAGATAFQEDMEALKHNWFLRGFFNSRGYEDSAELAKHEIVNLPEGSTMKTFVYDPKQIFSKQDGAKLKNEKALNDAGRFLEENQFGLAVVVSTSGMTGDTDKDRMLTQAQATVIRDYLVNHFKMDDTHLKTMALGKVQQAGASESGAIKIMIYSLGFTIPAL